MQRGGRAVETDIGGDGLRFGELVERVRLGYLMDEAALRQNVQEIGFIAAHRLSSLRRLV